MEININCDLGEKSKHHSNKNDPKLLDIVNTASIACGYHAGDENTMREVIDISVKKGVSFGPHPSFNDIENLVKFLKENLPQLQTDCLASPGPDLSRTPGHRRPPCTLPQSPLSQPGGRSPGCDHGRGGPPG